MKHVFFHTLFFLLFLFGSAAINEAFAQYMLNKNFTHTVYFNSDDYWTPANQTPQVKRFDWGQLIAGYPAGSSQSTTRITLNNTDLSIGTLTVDGNDIVFTPEISPIITGSGTVAYRVETTAGESVTTGKFTIHLLDQATDPGMIDSRADASSCAEGMGPITFTSATRFDGVHKANSSLGMNEYSLNGFTTPIIADLNGDGIPEILGQASHVADTYMQFAGLMIYDSSGNRICRLNFTYLDSKNVEQIVPFGNYFYQEAGIYHCAPSAMSVADIDHDGIIELFVAFPNTGGGSSNLSSRIALYKIIPDGATYKLKFIAKTAELYGPGPWQKPILTIVDINGDGNPEVVAYDKIYDAKTLNLVLELENNPAIALNKRLTLNALPGTLERPYVGAAPNCINYDGYVGFNQVYDLDLDGVYDVIAGGKAYLMNKDLSLKAVIQATDLSGCIMPDGRTGVADIDGDGFPDVVAAYKTDQTNLRIAVWTLENRTTNPTPKLLAQRDFVTDNSAGTGSFSNVFIGDIDGKVQNGKLLPEISVLRGGVAFSSHKGKELSLIHPLIRDIAQTPIDNLTPQLANTATINVLTSFTYDLDGSDSQKDERLKLSFVLQHTDTSINTGFTLFDFDNDGVAEICYRDMQSMRIIKPLRPFIPIDTNSEAFKTCVLVNATNVKSYTGFENPVIADIDNDGSAEIVVVGGNSSYEFFGFMYAFGNGSGDKYAPTRKLWNQYHYDPFMINDDLTVPSGPAPNRLDPKYQYTRLIRNNDMTVNWDKSLVNYNPYNNTMTQVPINHSYRMTDNNKVVHKVVEPLSYVPDAYLVTSGNEKPNLSTSGVLTFCVGNSVDATAAVAVNLPFRIYRTAVSGSNIVVSGMIGDYGVDTAIQAGTTDTVTVPGLNIGDIYIIRIGDSSTSTKWEFGTNSPTAVQDDVAHTGKVPRASRDCDWSNQMGMAAAFYLNTDGVVVQAYGTVVIDILANDILPTDGTLTRPLAANNMITEGPTHGKITIAADSKITYTNQSQDNLIDGFDSFKYKVTYRNTSGQTVEKEATVYIYVLQSTDDKFVNCGNSSYTIRLQELPAGNVSFFWYDDANISLPGGNPASVFDAGAITDSKTYLIRPVFSQLPYSEVNFEKGQLTVYALPDNPAVYPVMEWTGAEGTTNWFEPRNWKYQGGGVADYAPVLTCLDVLIPAGISTPNHYPTLTKPVEIQNITLGDHAMLGNLHFLNYANAKVEIKFTDSERNRGVLYSAPFDFVHSGDFMLRGVDGYPVKQAVYMSLFQTENPDNPLEPALAGSFSSYFAETNQALPLGQGFLLYLDKQKDSTTPFVFPSSMYDYEYYYASDFNAGYASLPLPKLSSSLWSGVGAAPVKDLFIALKPWADKTAARGNGEFTIDASGNLTNSDLLLVVNPFSSYLNVKAFLDANAGVLDPSVYYVLNNTNKNDGVIFQNSKHRWEVNTNPVLSTVTGNEYIAPYEAFFVLKKNSLITPLQLLYQPQTMTTTVKN
ncbi:MAG: hypothetical protein LBV57_04265 [Candidatus Symbiothrix sp.]|jgi:hypothetical protein|nr:hypothetical protein [Candidatus Symbiothrix sp.]